MSNLTVLDVIPGDTIIFAGLPFVVDSTKPYAKTPRVRMVLRNGPMIIRLNVSADVPINLEEKCV